MNHYGLQIQEHWEKVAPHGFSEMTNREAFFEGLGEEMLTRVDELVPTLMGSTPPGEDTLARVGRENAAKRQAEEIAWSELVTVTPERSILQERQAWAERDLSLAWLSDWADEQALGLELASPVDVVAWEWMLPTEFLQQLVAAPNPERFLELEPSRLILAKAQDDRFRAWTAQQEQ